MEPKSQGWPYYHPLKLVKAENSIICKLRFENLSWVWDRGDGRLDKFQKKSKKLAGDVKGFDWVWVR
jgi:hypothetical protein